MIIKVTQKHIDEGIPERQECCPIALALMEHDSVFCPHVEEHKITLWLAGERKEICTPSSAAEFIEAFDGGEEVAPFEFDLPV